MRTVNWLKLGNDMNQKENVIKGGVIIIGSLLWETKDNALADGETLAQQRQNWRNTNLNFRLQKEVDLPITYGRTSSTRKCTYTMVFSSLFLNKLGKGLIVPYKEEFDFNTFSIFKNQGIDLAKVEGISKSKEICCKNWGCIGIYINPDSINSKKIKKYWDEFRLLDDNYLSIKAADYKFDRIKEDISLLNEDYTLKSDCLIQTALDFLFFTYIKPKHRNEKSETFPTSEEVAEEIKISGYDTYFRENKRNGILTFNDKEIDQYLTTKSVTKTSN